MGELMIGVPPNRARWWTLAVVALIVGTVLVAVRKGRATSAEVDQLRAEIASIKDRDQEVRTVVLREVRTEPPVVPAASMSPDAAAPEAVLGREAMERRASASQQNLDNLYEESYAREAADPGWAESAVRTINERYAGKEFPTLKITAHCKKTICRVEFTFGDGPEAMAAAQKLVETDPWPSQRVTKVDGERHEGVMYISREGSDLPRFDPKTVNHGP